ncbi:isochorismatase family protein [Streptomyces sp. NPDC004959]|uniref:isochorismatase family protein n=1 Tax=unclassified Streptomyces TaxID=2593676 RepID=UPI0004C4BA06|nr:isochorismatase family protein [Streptomyces sp. NRRL F-5630]
MTATTLDARTALIVVDLQKGIAALTGAPVPSKDVVARSAGLAAAFRAKGLPVVLVNVTGAAPGRNEAPARGEQPPADWADLVSELDAQDSDIRVTKRTWGAFYGTDLDSQLRRRGVTQVVLTGIATSIGVESTARFAHEYGYNVTVVTDAVTDMNADAHANSVAHVFPRLGETGTTEEITALLG